MGIMALSENAQLVVLELVMDYVSPKEISIISAVHSYLQRKPSSFFRKAIRGFELSGYSPDDLEFKKSSFESVHVTVSADFSDIGRCFYYVLVSYLSMLTDELDLSGSLIDRAGLEILSKKCTNLFSLVLQRS